MVDSQTIAASTVTLMGVALFISSISGVIRSISGVINATSRLIQAASRLTKIIGGFFKNPLYYSVTRNSIAASLLKNTFSPSFLDIFKKPSKLPTRLLLKKPIRVHAVHKPVTFKKPSCPHTVEVEACWLFKKNLMFRFSELAASLLASFPFLKKPFISHPVMS